MAKGIQNQSGFINNNDRTEGCKPYSADGNIIVRHRNHSHDRLQKRIPATWYHT